MEADPKHPDFWDDPTPLDLLRLLEARIALSELGVEVEGGEYLKGRRTLLDDELIRTIVGGEGE